MKQATIQDYWRGLAKRPLQGHLQLLSGNSLPNFPSESIKISGAISVITGLNGVGKSTLLHSACLLLRRGDIPAIEIAALRGCGGAIEGKLLENGASLDLRTALDAGKATNTPESITTPVTWVDPAFEVPALIKEFRNEKNLNEALEQVGPSAATPEELQKLSWLVGKTYEACETFELEDFGERQVTPYFLVKASGMEYGTEAMGLGEAALHLLFWHLRRMQSDSVILIEEPETYVSARSQSAFMDLLAEACLRKKASALVTTHSAQVFAKVPPAHTLIVVKEGGQTRIITKETQAARLTALGVPTVEEKAGVLLVEDRLAREFAKVWFRRNRPELLRSWRIVDVGSAGQVTKKVAEFPDVGTWFRAVGLLDGDERAKTGEAKGIVCFLPGSEAPELLLKRGIVTSMQDIASALKIDADALRLVVSTVDGSEHHDWFLNVASSLNASGVTFESLVEAAYDAWTKIDNGAQASASFNELTKKILE